LAENYKYIAIEELKTGDKIMSLNNKLLTIGQIGYNQIQVGPFTKKKDRVYQINQNGNILNVTGGHPILLDEHEVTEQQTNMMKKELGKIRKLNDKIQLYTMYNDEAIDLGDNIYEIYNFYVLDQDKNLSTEVYANNILTECCSENYFKNKAIFQKMF
jgi:hypothetical protein